MDKLREKIAKIVSGSRCEVCNGCGAAIITDNPDDVADRILALIAEQGEPPVLSDKEIDEATYYGIGSRRLYAERNVAKTQRDACIPWGLAQKQAGYIQALKDHNLDTTTSDMIE